MFSKYKSIELRCTYVLKLEDDCWYVGCTNYLNNRLKQHWSSNGSEWTKLHKPIAVAAIYQGDYEWGATKYAIAKYGTKKVRGYGWTKSK